MEASALPKHLWQPRDSSPLSKRMDPKFSVNRHADEGVDLDCKIRSWMQRSSHPGTSDARVTTSTNTNRLGISQQDSRKWRARGKLEHGDQQQLSSDHRMVDNPQWSTQASDLADPTVPRSQGLRAHRSIRSRDIPATPSPQQQRPSRNPFADALAAWIEPLLCSPNCSCSNTQPTEAQDGSKIGQR